MFVDKSNKKHCEFTTHARIQYCTEKSVVNADIKVSDL